MTSQLARDRAGLVKSPLDLGGGVFLLCLAALGYAGGFNLPFGTLSGIGSGLLPKVVATLVAAFGVLLIVNSLMFEGDRLERWHLRGPVISAELPSCACGPTRIRSIRSAGRRLSRLQRHFT